MRAVCSCVVAVVEVVVVVVVVAVMLFCWSLNGLSSAPVFALPSFVACLNGCDALCSACVASP